MDNERTAEAKARRGMGSAILGLVTATLLLAMATGVVVTKTTELHDGTRVSGATSMYESKWQVDVSYADEAETETLRDGETACLTRALTAAMKVGRRTENAGHCLGTVDLDASEGTRVVRVGSVDLASCRSLVTTSGSLHGVYGAVVNETVFKDDGTVLGDGRRFCREGTNDLEIYLD